MENTYRVRDPKIRAKYFGLTIKYLTKLIGIVLIVGFSILIYLILSSYINTVVKIHYLKTNSYVLAIVTYLYLFYQSDNALYWFVAWIQHNIQLCDGVLN